jgi:hypothetical protein
MAIPPGAPQARYDTFLEYKEKKTGVKKMFTLQNYPQDTLWEFVDSKNVLIQEGYVPPIHDFTISNATEGDITAVVLDDKNYHFLLVAYALDKAETDNMSRINTLFNWCQRKGVAMRCLTSSVDTEIETFKKETHARFPFYSTDPTTLKTMIRANPGLMLIKNGTVIDMWHSNDIPDVEYFEKRLNK